MTKTAHPSWIAEASYRHNLARETLRGATDNHEDSRAQLLKAIRSRLEQKGYRATFTVVDMDEISMHAFPLEDAESLAIIAATGYMTNLFELESIEDFIENLPDRRRKTP